MLLFVVAPIVISGSRRRLMLICTTPSLLPPAVMARSSICRIFIFLLFVAFTLATADLVEEALVLLGNERVFIGTVHAVFLGLINFVFILGLWRWIFRKSMMVDPPFLNALLLLISIYPAIFAQMVLPTDIMHRDILANRLFGAHLVSFSAGLGRCHQDGKIGHMMLIVLLLIKMRRRRRS